MLDRTDLALLSESVSGLADHIRGTLFTGSDGVTADGDLTQIDGLIGQCAAMGLVADRHPEGDGYDLGVWGRHVQPHGARLSLLALSVLAEGCAGLAARVHAQGIGCLALDGWTAEAVGGPGETESVAAVFAPAYGVILDPRTAADVVQHVEDEHGSRLRGSSPFVWSNGAPAWLAVVARTGSDTAGDVGAGRMVVACRAHADGIVDAPLEAAVGLRALRRSCITFDRVPVDAASVVASGEHASRLVTRVVACDWLGQSAIALGSARRALREARTYAHERRQGGGVIAQHAAVRLLLAEADDAIAVMEAMLVSRADEGLADIADADLLRWAISSRLAVDSHALRAVTCCVQVLGGYGYMDDYGLSKRLRDVSALRARHGGREHLLLLLASLDAAGGS
jgi:alkylation response protein AidB-like acyl-CoA dehydrogenase